MTCGQGATQQVVSFWEPEIEPPVFSSSLDAVYQQHWTRLCRYIERAFGAGPPDPEDVAQEVFTKLAADQRMSSVSNPPAFLYRSARNLVLDHYRMSRVRAHFAEEAQSVGERMSEIHGESTLCARQHLAIVEAAMEAMAPAVRKVFQLKHLEGLRSPEIVALTGLSEPTVRRYLAKAHHNCEQAIAAAHEAKTWNSAKALARGAPARANRQPDE